MRPSAGSTTKEACREGVPCSPQCDGGPVPAPRRGCGTTYLLGVRLVLALPLIQPGIEFIVVQDVPSRQFRWPLNGVPCMSILGQRP